MITKSKRLFTEAKRFIPGGVNSPVRAFKAVGGTPLYIKRASGSKIYDADGQSYIDYICSWGPLILGHAHPEVIKAIKGVAKNGTSFGMNHPAEIRLARMITEAFPSIQRVRLVNSGTEAVMSAIRLARGFTKRDKIIKFIGCYHGHSDGLLVKAGSGGATFATPDSGGVPKKVAADTIPLPYNNISAVKRALKKTGKSIAAVIIEPVAGNMGVVLPQPGFLEGLRKLTLQYGILLIFDEVITGFRVTYGGVQTLHRITPDLTTLGKIIGGGLPVGAFGGRKEIMDMLAPQGKVYQAGTLSGNPIAVAAGLKTLEILKKNQRTIYPQLEQKADYLEKGLNRAAEKRGVKVWINRVGSMLTMFFTDQPVIDYASALTSDTKTFARYFRGMHKRGVNLPPSQFEAWFISTAHFWRDIDRTIETTFQSLKKI